MSSILDTALANWQEYAPLHSHRSPACPARSLLGLQVEELEAELEASQRLAQRFKAKLSAAQEEGAAAGRGGGKAGLC